MTDTELSDLLRRDADAAVVGGRGSRRPCHSRPANPTTDHRVAFLLGGVKSAVKAAVEAGATYGELENIIAGSGAPT